MIPCPCTFHSGSSSEITLRSILAGLWGGGHSRGHRVGRRHRQSADFDAERCRTGRPPPWSGNRRQGRPPSRREPAGPHLRPFHGHAHQHQVVDEPTTQLITVVLRMSSLLPWQSESCSRLLSGDQSNGFIFNPGLESQDVEQGMAQG